MKTFFLALWAVVRGLFTDPINRARSKALGVPSVSGASGAIERTTGLIGVVIGLLIVVFVLASALPLGISTLIAVDTGSPLFNIFMNVIMPLVIAAFAIFVGLRFLKMSGDDN